MPPIAISLVGCLNYFFLFRWCVCVSLVRVVIICPASTHTALVSSPSLAVLHTNLRQLHQRGSPGFFFVPSWCVYAVERFLFFTKTAATSSG